MQVTKLDCSHLCPSKYCLAHTDSFNFQTINFFLVNARVLLKSKQGYIVGSGLTDPDIDYNERVPYAHRVALISDEYFEVIIQLF